jgi:hypothetical protein
MRRQTSDDKAYLANHESMHRAVFVPTGKSDGSNPEFISYGSGGGGRSGGKWRMWWAAWDRVTVWGL